MYHKEKSKVKEIKSSSSKDEELFLTKEQEKFYEQTPLDLKYRWTWKMKRGKLPFSKEASELKELETSSSEET